MKKAAPKKAAKSSGKRAPVKKAAPKKAAARTRQQKKPAAAAGSQPPAQTADQKSTTGRKGITIVSKKPAKRVKGSPGALLMPPSPGVPSLGAAFDRPLIPSGPAAAATKAGLDVSEAMDKALRKSPFNKRELAKFQKILHAKRQELMDEIAMLERETLRGTDDPFGASGTNIDDQGSEAAERSLSLDIVAAERKLLREIEDAMRRIDAGTYGLCELTGRPIRRERLEELPWTRYSIDAARELERRSLGP